MSNLILPFLPAFTPKQAKSLNIKNTSWKNARKFIKALDKHKLVLAKERPGNEVDILDIDFEDSNFKDFQPYRLPKKEVPGSSNMPHEAAKAAANGAETSGDDSIGQQLKRIELFKPKETLAPVLQAGGARYALVLFM